MFPACWFQPQCTHSRTAMSKSRFHFEQDSCSKAQNTEVVHRRAVGCPPPVLVVGRASPSCTRSFHRFASHCNRCCCCGAVLPCSCLVPVADLTAACVDDVCYSARGADLMFKLIMSYWSSTAFPISTRALQVCSYGEAAGAFREEHVSSGIAVSAVRVCRCRSLRKGSVEIHRHCFER